MYTRTHTYTLKYTHTHSNTRYTLKDTDKSNATDVTTLRTTPVVVLISLSFGSSAARPSALVLNCIIKSRI